MLPPAQTGLFSGVLSVNVIVKQRQNPLGQYLVTRSRLPLMSNTYYKQRRDRSGRFVDPKAKRTDRGASLRGLKHQPRRAYEKVCDVCGEPYTAHRRNRKYCSQMCQQRAWHDRKAGAPEMVGITGDELRVYQVLQVSKPEIARLCVIHYELFGREAASSLLSILNELRTKPTSRPDQEQKKPGILSRLGRS
jgi:hypothetical protein